MRPTDKVCSRCSMFNLFARCNPPRSTNSGATGLAVLVSGSRVLPHAMLGAYPATPAWRPSLKWRSSWRAAARACSAEIHLQRNCFEMQKLIGVDIGGTLVKMSDERIFLIILEIAVMQRSW